MPVAWVGRVIGCVDALERVSLTNGSGIGEQEQGCVSTHSKLVVGTST